MLITDKYGNFLTYSKLNFVFSDEYIAKTFYKLFVDLKPCMDRKIETIEAEIDWKNVKLSKGFEILEAYANREADLVEKI